MQSLSGYKQHDHIDPHHMEMASAAMIHFGLDPRNICASCRANTPASIGMFIVHKMQFKIMSHQMITITSNEYCSMDAPLN
jgi:hypothetical protein